MIDVSRADKILGFMEIDELRWLAETASKYKNICEIGSWKGRSTRAIADNMPQDAELTVVDLFKDGYLEGKELRATFEENLHEYLEAGRISICQMDSETAAELFAKVNIKFDMIFVDGEHFYEYAYNDIRNYLPLLSPGGILCGHDYTPNAPEFGGVIKAVHELVPEGFRVNIPTGRIWEYRQN